MSSASAGRSRNGLHVVLAVIAVALSLAGTTCIAVAVIDRPHPLPRPLGRSDLPELRSVPAAALPLAANEARSPVLTASPPVDLAIPAIGVRSSLLRLGLTAQGALEVPARGPHHDLAAWYRFSPAPGSLGPSIIVGHADSANGPSVFFRLGRLRLRDSVLVTRADGSVAAFAVDAVRRYRKSDFPSALVYGNTDRATLRLISCAGPLDPDSGHHRDNVVVFATLVGDGRTPAPGRVPRGQTLHRDG